MHSCMLARRCWPSESSFPAASMRQRCRPTSRRWQRTLGRSQATPWDLALVCSARCKEQPAWHEGCGSSICPAGRQPVLLAYNVHPNLYSPTTSTVCAVIEPHETFMHVPAPEEGKKYLKCSIKLKKCRRVPPASAS